MDIQGGYGHKLLLRDDSIPHLYRDLLLFSSLVQMLAANTGWVNPTSISESLERACAPW